MARETFASINCSLMWHEKVESIPESDRLGVIGWYTAVTAYCELNRTDGFLAYTRFGAVGPFSEQDRKRYTRAAIAVGLFDEVDGGIEIHNFLIHNKSKAQIEAGRKGMSDGGKKSGDTRRKKHPKPPSEATFGRFAEIDEKDEGAEEDEIDEVDEAEGFDLALASDPVPSIPDGDAPW